MSAGKTIALSFGSAILGGSLVLAILKWEPELLNIKANNSVKTNNSVEITEKNSNKREDLFDSFTQQQKKMRKQLDSFFDEDFLGQNDPFESMRKFRKELEEETKEFVSGSVAPFDSWYGHKFGGGNVSDIEKREDEAYVYYDIKVEDLNSTTLNAKVENGYITITGRIEKKTGSNDDDLSSQSVFSSTFSRTFPLPANVDEDKMEMLSGEDKVVLKFPKKKI